MATFSTTYTIKDLARLNDAEWLLLVLQDNLSPRTRYSIEQAQARNYIQ